MSMITQSIPGAYDATLEEEFDRVASRLSEQADLQLEGMCRRATVRLEEVLGNAVAKGVPVVLRLEQLGERL